MSSRMKNVFQENFTYLKKHLIVEHGLTDYLFEHKVLSWDQQEEIRFHQQRPDKVHTLIDLMIRKSEEDFNTFLQALKYSEQQSIKEKQEAHMNTLQSKEGEQVESVWESAREEQMETEDNMDTSEGTVPSGGAGAGGDGGCNDDDGGESDEDAAALDDDDDDDDDDGDDDGDGVNVVELQDIEDFNHSSLKKLVTFQGEIISGPKPAPSATGFMVEIADNTSAVDCWVHEEFNPPSYFKEGEHLILQRVKWNGRVICVYKESHVTKTNTDLKDLDGVRARAFGSGESTRISSLKESQSPNESFAVSGRIVKVSDPCKKKLFGGRKILTHRLVRIDDGSGFLDLDVWGDIAPGIELDTILRITSCKGKIVHGVKNYTTTPKSEIQTTQETFPDVKVKRGMVTGTLKSISVETFQACPTPECYHCPLGSSAHCPSCLKKYVVGAQHFAKGKVSLETKTGQLKSFGIFWPELEKLFQLFEIEVSISDEADVIERKFLSLVKTKRRIKYYGYGNLQRFKMV